MRVAIFVVPEQVAIFVTPAQAGNPLFIDKSQCGSLCGESITT